MALSLSSHKRKFVPEWGDNKTLPSQEQITLQYSPLSVEDLFEVQRDTKINVMAGMQFEVEDVEAVDSHWQLIKHVLVKYTSDYTGITLDGDAVTGPEPLFQILSPVHMELLAEIFGAVLNASTGSEEDVKNSGADSEQEKQENVLTVESASATD